MKFLFWLIAIIYLTFSLKQPLLLSGLSLEILHMRIYQINVGAHGKNVDRFYLNCLDIPFYAMTLVHLLTNCHRMEYQDNIKLHSPMTFESLDYFEKNISASPLFINID